MVWKMLWTCPGRGLRTRYVGLNCDFSLRTDKKQSVYVYQPAKAGKASGERRLKRRKVGSSESRKQQPAAQSFVPLLNGEETSECVRLRYDTYKELWSEQENRIQVGIIS